MGIINSELKVNLKLLSLGAKRKNNKEKQIEAKGFMVPSSGLIYTLGDSKRVKRGRMGAESSFEKIMAANFPNLRKYKNTRNSTNSK